MSDESCDDVDEHIILSQSTPKLKQHLKKDNQINIFKEIANHSNYTSYQNSTVKATSPKVYSKWILVNIPVGSKSKEN